jgi:hypothetical protein
MKILIACEESQAVTIEFRKRGFDAYSCDILPCSGNHPEWHIQGDVLEQLDKGWDCMIAFPPCTHLAVSGAAWFEQKRKDGRQQQGIDFFMKIINAPIKYIAVENPVGIMSTFYRKPDQIIQPYMFGDSERKSTCLWLTGLPKLIPTNIVKPVFSKSGLTKTHIGYGKNKNSKMRSKTFPGIAEALADQYSRFILSGMTVKQWGDYLLTLKPKQNEKTIKRIIKRNLCRKYRKRILARTQRNWHASYAYSF